MTRQLPKGTLRRPFGRRSTRSPAPAEASEGAERLEEVTLKEESLFVVIPTGEVGGNGRISSASLR